MQHQQQQQQQEYHHRCSSSSAQHIITCLRYRAIGAHQSLTIIRSSGSLRICYTMRSTLNHPYGHQCRHHPRGTILLISWYCQWNPPTQLRMSTICYHCSIICWLTMCHGYHIGINIAIITITIAIMHEPPLPSCMNLLDRCLYHGHRVIDMVM